MCIPVITHLLWTALSAIIITRRHRDPAVAATWILLIFTLPIIGTLLYILAGWHAPPHPAPAPYGRLPHPIARLIASNCGSAPSMCNHLELLHNGNNAFSALITALQRAGRSIHMEYYIFRDDRIGCAIAEILMRKARAGVEVRLIYDAVGSWRLSRRILRNLRKAGVEVHAYAPIRFPWFTPRANRRNHRKIVITDGRVAFLGGINIAKYYLDGDGMGKWRDEHLRIEGDAVADLQRLFIADWSAVSGAQLEPARYIAPHRIHRPLPMQIAWAEEGASRRTLIETFAAAIHRARHTVRISSPYFMPPPMILDAIRTAARSGIRVMAMIPTCSDSPVTDLISDSFVDDLLDAGVEVYRYDNGFLHAKVLITDNHTASVGTANMDYRSLCDNLEVTAFIYDRTTIESLISTFDEDLTRCMRVPSESRHSTPAWRRTTSALLRLISPFM